MTIERAFPEDHLILTELTKQSKAFWGYSEAQIEKWSDLLTVSADHIASNDTFKLLDGDEIIGYYSVVKKSESAIKLDSLFILPAHIGKGFGKMLMSHLFDYLRARNFKTITLDAEPFAENFYAAFGFEVVGKLQSSIPRRFLPLMEKKFSG